MTSAQRKADSLSSDWARFREFADRLCGDRVLLPLEGGRIDWDAVDRDTVVPARLEEITAADLPRLAVIIDGFYKWMRTSEPITVCAAWREGTPELAQIDGRYSAEAMDLVQDVVAGQTSFEAVEATRRDLDFAALEGLRETHGGELRQRPHGGDWCLYGATVDGRIGQLDIGPDGASRFWGAMSKPAPAAANDNAPLGAIDAETLLGLDFPPVEYIVPGYVTEGLTILAGRPKLGKSWMALGMCVGVASGGQTLDVDCEAGDALYLALEDNRRRLQDRLKVVLPRHPRPDVRRLQLLTEAPKVNAGLLQRLDQWRASVAEPKLVVIDTLSMVRPPKKANQDSYAADYDAISPLQKWAGEHRLAVVVVHHVRKAEADDPLESVSGTNGLTGAADTILVLNRTTDGPKLYGRGRDIEEFEKALRLQDGLWSVLGNADDVKRSDQRRKIIAVLEEAPGVMTPAEIAKETGTPVGGVNYLLRAMVKAGEAEKIGYGAYKLPGR